MGSLYGNIISHIPRSQFEINKTYQSRVDMDTNIENDNISIYAYVLVDYGDPGATYNGNLTKDQDAYGGENSGKDYKVNYDKTVWLKQWDKTKNKYYYRAVDRLHSILPTFQDMSARNIVIENEDTSSDGFGTDFLYGYYYSYDKESATLFNERYSDSEIKIELDENGTWNGELIRIRIEDKISELTENIENKNNILLGISNNIDTNLNSLDNYYNNLTEQYEQLVSVYSTLIVPDNSEINNNINTNIEEINTNLTSINEKQNSLSNTQTSLEEQKSNLLSLEENLNQELSNLKTTYENPLDEQVTLLSEINLPSSAKEYLETIKTNFVPTANELITDLDNNLSGKITNSLVTHLQELESLISSLLTSAQLSEDVFAQTVVSEIEDENKINAQIALVKLYLNSAVTNLNNLLNHMSPFDSLEDKITEATTEELSLTLELIEIGDSITNIKNNMNNNIISINDISNNIISLLNNIITNIENSIILINDINTLYEANISKENSTLVLLNEYENNLNEYENKITEIYNLISEIFAIENNDLNYNIFETIFYYLEDTLVLLTEYKNSSIELIDLEESKNYYEEMLNWFNDFTSNMTESFVYEIPKKTTILLPTEGVSVEEILNSNTYSRTTITYATDTIEYPIK